MSQVASTPEFQALLEAAPDAMVIIDPEGRVLHVNAQLQKLFGYQGEELLGKPVEILIPPRFRDARPLHWKDYLGATGVELYGLRRDGTEFPAEVSLSPLRTKSELLVIAAIRDGTSRSKVEERFRRILDAAPDAMVIANAEGQIQLVNTQAAALFGYSKEELLGKPVEVLIPERYRLAHPSHRADYASQPRTRPMGAGGLSLFGQRKDGTEFPAEISLSLLESDEGPLAITAIRDDTERKGAEEHHSKLVQAQEAIRMRDEFLSIASHELKTPLTALQMQVESGLRLAQKQREHPIPPTLVKKLSDMFDGTRRLATLINQLLDLSRITAGRLKIERERMDLSAAARNVIRQFQVEIERANCQLHFHADKPIWGFWDPFRVEQILSNLISNAIKYGDKKPIEVSVTEEYGRARLTVRDHGIGIAPENQARIFERFERIVSTRNYGGFGLGLWIVRQIIEEHHGSINVWSQPTAGSTFTVELPVGAADAISLPSEVSSSPSIMLVDDDPTIRSTFCEAVQEEGFTVVAASNGADALQLLRSGARPRLIFLDLMMPIMDAWAFRAEQQKLAELGQIPVVIVSAAEGVDKIADSLGAAGYLRKPIQLDPLFQLVGRYCATADSAQTST